MIELDFGALEAKVEELIALCGTLAKENKTLRDERQAWRDERAQLAERNQATRTKIDAMIHRVQHPDEAP